MTFSIKYIHIFVSIVFDRVGLENSIVMDNWEFSINGNWGYYFILLLFPYAFQNIVPVLSISWPGAAARRVVQKCGACHREFKVY